MNYYGLIGSLSAKKGKDVELVHLLKRAAGILKETEGCYQYIIAQEQLDPKWIWITEIWSSKDAHDESLRLKSIKEIIKLAVPLMEESPRMGVETYPLLCDDIIVSKNQSNDKGIEHIHSN